VIGSALDVLIGALEAVLALAVLLHLWRFRRGFPWLVAVIAFFLLRGVDRGVVAFVGDEPATLGFLLDALLVGVLVLLLVGMERVVRGLELALDAARFREAEYRRALVDYRTLVRHRLANPITSIIGSVRTVRQLSAHDQELRDELLEILDRQARRLEGISLDPRDELTAEERALQPQPRDSSL
jgi:signal transduction histidine kinase